jgi:hypothetical protein
MILPTLNGIEAADSQQKNDEDRSSWQSTRQVTLHVRTLCHDECLVLRRHSFMDAIRQLNAEKKPLNIRPSKSWPTYQEPAVMDAV